MNNKNQTLTPILSQNLAQYIGDNRLRGFHLQVSQPFWAIFQDSHFAKLFLRCQEISTLHELKLKKRGGIRVRQPRDFSILILCPLSPHYGSFQRESYFTIAIFLCNYGEKKTIFLMVTKFDIVEPLTHFAKPQRSGVEGQSIRPLPTFMGESALRNDSYHKCNCRVRFTLQQLARKDKAACGARDGWLALFLSL